MGVKVKKFLILYLRLFGYKCPHIDQKYEHKLISFFEGIALIIYTSLSITNAFQLQISIIFLISTICLTAKSFLKNAKKIKKPVRTVGTSVEKYSFSAFLGAWAYLFVLVIFIIFTLCIIFDPNTPDIPFKVVAILNYITNLLFEVKDILVVLLNAEEISFKEIDEVL